MGVLLSAAEHALLTPSLLPHAAAAVHAALELHQRETGAAAACGTQQPSLLCMQQPSQAVSGGLMLLPSGQSVSAASGSASGAAGMVTGPEVCAQRTHSMGVMSSSVCVVSHGQGCWGELFSSSFYL